MFYTKDISIYNMTEYVDINGITRQDKYSFIKNLKVDVQPYSSEKLKVDYGYDFEVTKRVFCDVDIDIAESTIIKYKNTCYDIQKIIEWDDYIELMLVESEVEINE